MLVFGLIAAALVGPRLMLLGVAYPLSYNEGWNLYRAALVQAGGQLYGAPPALWVTNYPPLSFHMTAILDRVIGDLSLVGRLLSLLGLAASSVMVGACVREITANRWAALVAALLPAIWIGLYQSTRIPLNDPQLLATGFIVLGFYCYLRAGATGAALSLPAGATGAALWLVGSATAIAIGLFTKTNLFDLPLAIFLHLLWRRRGRDLAIWIAAGALVALALLATSRVLDGPHFMAHVLMPRGYVLLKGIRMTGGFLTYFGGALVLAVLWGRHHLRPDPRGLLVLALATSFAVGVALAPGNGLDRNNFFDTLIALAMVSGVALHDARHWFTWRRPPAALVLLALLLVPGVAKLPERIRDSRAMLQDAPRQHAAFAAGVQLLADARRPAICENMQLCFAAGQPLDYEPFFVDDQLRRARMDAAPVLALLQARHWGAIVLSVAPDTPLVAGAARERFSAPVMAAILANYQPALTTANFVILLPAEPPGR